MRIVLAACCLAVLFGCTSEDTAPTESRARAIEREVWSPYCPGRLLVDCTTDQARQLRNEIDKRVERGDSTDAILAWIRTNHGDEALARPEARGAGLVIWLVPAAIFLAGAVVVAVAIRRGTTPKDRAPTAST
jgi:cytochrome c-type biogenesis protein CcmH/NrfF